jgi:CRISPR-associated protein Cas1
MTERILDLSERPAHLSVRNELLVIRFGPVAAVYDRRTTGDAEVAATEAAEAALPETHTIPLAEIAVVIASHPQISYTHAVLAGLAAAGGMFVVCDPKHLPAAMLLPLVTHSTQTERFAAQAKLSLPTGKRLWQQIVQAKLRAQARLLEERTGKDWGLGALAGRVRSGDPDNLEGQAARMYWRALFEDESFRRDPEGEGVNSCLNYGYAVLRAAVARAICGTGLHPSLGIHHHNRYDAFCLADDLMEPFRPVVDCVVAKLRDARGNDIPLDKEAKRALLEALLGRFTADNESRTLFDWVSRTACSLSAVIEGSAEKLEIPRLWRPPACGQV